jgi:type IV pilus assembly protein PilO
MMLSRLSSRNIALIIVGVCALLGILWWTLLFTPTQANIGTLQTEIGDELAPAPESLLGRKQVGERARANVTQLCGTVASLKTEQAVFLQKLPDRTKLADLIDDLKNKILASGAEINSISPSAGNAANLPAGVRTLNLALALDGTWSSITNVLQSVESLQRFSKIETLSLSTSTANSFNPKLGTQIAMTTYVYDNPATANSSAVTGENVLCQSTSMSGGVR